jgi:GABA(A) receptor-associated protein
MNNFKKKHSFSKRLEEANRILNKYPNKIPIIVQEGNNYSLPKLEKIKYLVPNDITMGQFMFVIRKRLKLRPEMSLILFVNNKLIPNQQLLSDVYPKEKDVDNFLYMSICQESTFG